MRSPIITKGFPLLSVFYIAFSAYIRFFFKSYTLQYSKRNNIKHFSTFY